MIESISNSSIAYFGGYARSPMDRYAQKDAYDQQSSTKGQSNETDAEKEKPFAKKLGKEEELSPDEKRQLDELKQRDTEVRNHENAHLAAAGSLATSGANFTFQAGPDGKNYAIGGDVHIDTSPGRTPEESIQKAQTIRAAALAPADPSPQDLKVAAAASQMEMQAAAKLTKQRSEDSDPNEPSSEITSSRQIASESLETPAEETAATERENGLSPKMQRAANLYRQLSQF